MQVIVGRKQLECVPRDSQHVANDFPFHGIHLPLLDFLCSVVVCYACVQNALLGHSATIALHECTDCLAEDSDKI